MNSSKSVKQTERGLEFVGAVGTGFTDRAMRELQQRLDALARPGSPFAEPLWRENARGARWVEPVLVGEVAYRQWIVNPTTGGHRLRHPSWRGLRADKAAVEVVLDVDAPR